MTTEFDDPFREDPESDLPTEPDLPTPEPQRFEGVQNLDDPYTRWFRCPNPDCFAEDCVRLDPFRREMLPHDQKVVPPPCPNDCGWDEPMQPLGKHVTDE